MPYKAWTLAIAFVLSAAQGGVAFTPLALVFAQPADRAVFSEPPTRIRLIFSERIDPSQAAIVLIASDSTAIRLTPAIDPHLVDGVIAHVPPLKPGTYRVQWQIASARGLSLSGSYLFAFGPGAALPAANDSSGVEAPDGLFSRISLHPTVLHGLELVLAVVLVGLLLLRRKSGTA